MSIYLDIGLSLLGVAISIALFMLCSHQAGKPNDTPEPRMVPWKLLSFLPVVFALLIVAHLMSLAGVETGVKGGAMRF